jgi:DNA-binding response OmpR family regulator
VAGELTMKCHSPAKGGILVIDDDSSTLADLTRILSMGGYTCHCCRDLATAVEQFHENTPRLVIADLAIVGPNGYRLNQALYPDFGHMSVPLMFLSSGQHPDIIHRHGDNGGSYYLRKPIEVVVLLELVDKALWNRKLAAAALAM